MTARSHYDVLGLNGPPSSYGQDDIKIAYKRALLLHHPDKSKETSPIYSIDSITHAFKTLSDAAARREYDRDLVLNTRQRLGVETSGGSAGAPPSGIETVDLDDLTMLGDEETEFRAGDEEAWIKHCRCGQSYIITEAQLEREAHKGELLLHCDGCSLGLRVLFQVDA